MEDTDGNTALMSALQDLLANGIAALKLTSAALKGDDACVHACRICCKQRPTLTCRTPTA